MTLNALSADFTSVSIALLGERASFEEIGKRSIWSMGAAEAAAPLARFHPIAVDVAMLADPRWMQMTLLLLSCRAGRGDVRGLPAVAFPFADVKSAFRFLQRGQNVGKVVLVLPPRAGRTGGRAAATARAAHLVTGGTGALGLLTAGWLGLLRGMELDLPSLRGRPKGTLRIIGAHHVAPGLLVGFAV